MINSIHDITTGSRVRGITGDDPVEIISITWHGSSSATVVYKTLQGNYADRLIVAGEEAEFEIVESAEWALDADPYLLKLTSEAYRISLAHLFDPYLAIRTSQIEPLPHQISAVYEEMLPKMPLRFLLADDPGAGKTIMAGLLIKEMLTRGDLERCLIVAPGNLVEQWQDELFRKFKLNFSILSNDMIDASLTRNVFKEKNQLICRLDKLSRNEDLQAKLLESRWDLIICDEAHKMSASTFGGEVRYTKRYHLGELLGDITENLLLMTATPHNGKPEDFQLFMALLDKDRFAGAARAAKQRKLQAVSLFDNQEGDSFELLPPSDDDDLKDVMRRLIKEELLKFDGRPLFPERRAYTVNYTLSPAEAGLYHAVTDYVSEEFNRADRLEGNRKNSVGFALTLLQRRLASSPEAIYQSLKRRRERLQARLVELNDIASGRGSYSQMFASDDFDEDDYTAEELESLDESLIDTASASATAAELKAEIETLELLERMANGVRMSGEDRKWDELSRLLQDETAMFAPDGSREKLIIFTEHKDTLNYLATKIASLLGDHEAVVTIKGGMAREERHRIEELFKQDRNVRILVATDAAGEGINLQRAHLMVNYDLPWNPNRIEQRFGRIHRIGQTEVCHLWNLVSRETREGQVFDRLFTKLNEERSALGGRVFDILGRVTFDDKPLRDLLIDAIRYGNQPDVRERLNRVVDSSLDGDALKKILEEYALTTDVMDARSVAGIREEMERAEARKLEPHFIEAFFLAALTALGGSYAEREPGRYEILDVPFDVRSRNMLIGLADPVLDRYERVCFTKENITSKGGIIADLLCPGHPLLDAVVKVTLEKNADVLKRGSILIDEENATDSPRMLFYIESTIKDGNIEADGTNHTVSKAVHFVEIDADGKARSAGYAPYLDYRPPRPGEATLIEEIRASLAWDGIAIENMAQSFANEHIVPEQMAQVRNRVMAQTSKIRKAVEKRLTSEIQYWDSRAWELKDKEKEGKFNRKISSIAAEKRAEELAERLEVRRIELDRAGKLTASSPRIIGGALVIPSKLLLTIDAGQPIFSQADVDSKRKIELAAMNAVMSIERELGNTPKDVSADKIGYDIESSVSETERLLGGDVLRFIEVKGRAAGADTVTLSNNEIATANNKHESYYLAVVEIDGNKTNTTYIRLPKLNNPDFATVSVTYRIRDLIAAGSVVLEKEQIWQ